ncbi:MAG: DUF2140 family protein [Alicyclobacillus sp.]|nr:DUF2140 family protein [Alicyclobacillus sp.]
MWKKAFVTLLSLNLMLLVGITLWFGSLPRPSAPPRQDVPSDSGKAANVQLAIGPSAINTYLEYALADEPDVSRVLSFARVHFGQHWDVQVGLKLYGKVVPCDVEFAPSIQAGNLQLHVLSATVGQIPMPTSLLMLIFRHVPWPNWIAVDVKQQNLNLNFTERAQHPYGIHVVGYSSTTKRLTLNVSILPKALLAKSGHM